MPYIYKITNSINGKLYVGKTSLTIEERFKEHISDSKTKSKNKRPLYEAFNKYGVEHFTIDLLEEVKDDEEACKREIYWIDYLRTYIGFDDCNGYNATLGGDSKRYYNYQEIAKKYQELGYLSETSRFFNCDEDTVKKACLENGVEIVQKPQKTKIQRIGADGSVVIFDSISDAAKSIVNKEPETARKNISRAVHTGRLGYGYRWRFVD